MAGHISYSLRGPWDCCSSHEAGVLEFVGSAPCMVTSGCRKEAVGQLSKCLEKTAEEDDDRKDGSASREVWRPSWYPTSFAVRC